jgi:hypothetical protein
VERDEMEDGVAEVVKVEKAGGREVGGGRYVGRW